MKRLNLTGTDISGTKDELKALLPFEGCRVYPGKRGILAAKEVTIVEWSGPLRG